MRQTNDRLGAQFEKIFAINLPRRTDHRDRLSLASKVSNITIEYVNGVRAGSIDRESLPADYSESLSEGVLSAWRAHLNVLRKCVLAGSQHHLHLPLLINPQRIIDQDVSSALILEDDVDWDVRLKSLLYEFAGSTNALASTDLETADWGSLPEFPAPQHSPYGDSWDAMWLGHCGMQLPRKNLVLHQDDPSVPQHQYLKSWDVSKPTPLSEYPQHTRAIFRPPIGGTCSLAYAVTQSAARRLLYDIGIDKLDDPYDIMLRNWCERPQSVCMGVLPQLFDHFRRKGPVGADSDINSNGDEVRETSYSNNIRWSVQKNLRKMLQGTDTYEDQYPDV